MSIKIVNLSTGAPGSGTSVSPYNVTQLANDVGLTGDGTLTDYQMYGRTTYTGGFIDIKRSNTKLSKYQSYRTPPRIKFTDNSGFRIITEDGTAGATSEHTINISQCMIEKTGASGGSVISTINSCTGSSKPTTKVTIEDCLIRADYTSITGDIISDLSTGVKSTSHYIRACDIIAGSNVRYGINLDSTTACSNADVDSNYFEGVMIPIRKTSVSITGSYKYSCFRNNMDVRYKNNSLVSFNYDPLDNTIQYGNAVSLSGCMTGDQFFDSQLNNYSIVQVYDGLDRIRIGAITGDVNDTTPTEYRQGSIVRRYHPTSIGIGGTGGSTGSLPSGVGNKDNRMLQSDLNFSNYSILNMVLPTAIMPTGGASDIRGQANPALGLTCDIMGELRGTGDIGCKEYRRVLNDFEVMPERDGVNVKSTINKDAVVAMADFDTYFDNATELSRVDVWYVHEDGRQEKHMIHQGSAGGPLTCRVNWSTFAKEGIWKKTRIKLIGWNGSELMMRGRVTANGYEDIIMW